MQKWNETTNIESFSQQRSRIQQYESCVRVISLRRRTYPTSIYETDCKLLLACWYISEFISRSKIIKVIHCGKPVRKGGVKRRGYLPWMKERDLARNSLWIVLAHKFYQIQKRLGCGFFLAMKLRLSSQHSTVETENELNLILDGLTTGGKNKQA